MATTDTIWLTDPEIETQLTAVQARYNAAGAELGLFTDTDVDPVGSLNPELVLGDFIEPVLTGYARVDLEGTWTAPARDEAGVWSIQTEIFTIAVDPAETGNVDVYGVILILGGDLVAFGLFDAPFNWSDGVPIRVRVVYTQYAALEFRLIVLA